MIKVVPFQTENITLWAYQFLRFTSGLHTLVELLLEAMLTHLAFAPKLISEFLFIIESPFIAEIHLLI